MKKRVVLVTVFLSLLLFFLVVFVADLATYQLSFGLQLSAQSVNLQHGKPVNVSFTMINPDVFCSLSCNYSLYGAGIIVDAQESKIIDSNSNLTITYSLAAPSKEAGGISGQNFYWFSASCEERNNVLTSIICSNSNSQGATFTLNYDISSEEKTNKTYLDANLPLVNTNLGLLEKEIYNLQSRFNKTPQTVLVNDLKDRFTQINNEFNNYTLEQKEITDYYNSLDFFGAYNLYSQYDFSGLQSLLLNASNLDQDLTGRFDLHNNLTREINSFSPNLNSLIPLIKVFSLQTTFTAIDYNIQEVSSEFSSASFQNYSDVELTANAIASEISDLNQTLRLKETNLKKDFINQVNNETNKLCNYGDCNTSISLNENTSIIDFLNLTCTVQVPALSNEFQKTNLQLKGQYSFEINMTAGDNQVIGVENYLIGKLNSIRQYVYQLLNNDSYQTDVSYCDPNLVNVSITELNQTISNCTRLQNDIILQISNPDFSDGPINFTKKTVPGSVLNYSDIHLLNLETVPPLVNLTFENNFQENINNYCYLNASDLTPSNSSVSGAVSPQGEVLVNSSLIQLAQHQSQCCVFGSCKPCCEGDSCQNDVTSYPIILLHGHAFFESSNVPAYPLDDFNSITGALQSDGIIPAGILTPSTDIRGVPEGDWGKAGVPLSVKVTYYYGVYDENGKSIAQPSENESIETYAKRLKDSIDLLKYRTNRSQVIIIAHSMGGLVAREYIREFGSDSVYKLIMIATPNNGITSNAAQFCNLLSGTAAECNEMEGNSTFLQTLNSQTPVGNTSYYTIAGTGCGGGDGVVDSNNVYLYYGTNYLVPGKCAGVLNTDMHTQLLDPKTYPLVFSTLLRILKQ
ncbi:Uncharacterised protein [uncultured archaeon]|nr:Uncharacterised protein [uncultured archaeon]